MKSLFLFDPSIVANINRSETSFSLGSKESDKAALEKLIELKNAGIVTEVWTLSVISSPNETNEFLTYAFALGSDRVSIIVKENYQPWDKFGIAECIYQIVKDFNLGLIMCGCDKVGCSPVGSLLASMMSMSYFGKVHMLSIEDQGYTAHISREIGGGYSETIVSKLPLVVGVDPHIERPHIYPTFYRIKKAARSKVEKIITNPDLAIDKEKMLFIKSQPNRIPVKIRSDYPKESSSQNRIRHIIGRSNITENSHENRIVSNLQSVKNLIDLLEVNNLL